jgi:patatin-like phospholipase/acyl hydrolase
MAQNRGKSFRNKLKPTAQKKLLAIDGGGIRGVISLEILLKIESILRSKTGDSGLVLSDYFDYIAGTSTGAIIATCIAIGMSVEEIRKFYVESGPAMFTRAGILRRFQYKFEQDALAEKLRQVLGADTKLGTETLETLLLLMMRNATTDSPWPISNNPGAKYNNIDRPDCNLRIPLWQLVRASTAAPTYFPPELVSVGERNFLFVDGGVTMYNNPAFQLFLMATVEPYNLNWPTGVDKLLLVSVGTGTSPKANANLQPDDMNLLYNASSIPSALMFAALNEQDFLCRVFGDCLAGCALDREVSDMKGKRGPAMPKLFTYMRYNAELTAEGLAQLGLAGIKPENVQALDSIDHITELQRVGQAVGEREVRQDHFDRF